MSGMTEDDKVTEVIAKLDGPRFQHDCSSCRFLGYGEDKIHFTDPRSVDLYYCEYERADCTKEITLVARFGNSALDHSSMDLSTWQQVKDKPVRADVNHCITSTEGHWLWEAERLYEMHERKVK